ncbi:hypothetical protein BGZ83_002153 [Gryganskiella cystojenkinii]|nr:hypothetical protein BGZ83_002153 [Gryganskiella cystojenkinii]
MTLETATILMAVGSIYVLDFAINCVQASCRTLIVDSLPSSQQETAASWASRLMGIGGILGYFMGNVDLPKRVPFFGDTQIKGLCVIANLFLVFCVGLTCLTVTERVVIYTQEQFINGTPVVVEPNTGPGLDSSAAGVRDAAVRAGSFCLLVYSVVSLAASIVLPVLTAPAASVQTTSVSSGPFGNQRSMTGFADEIGRKRGSKWQGLNIPRWARPPIKGLTLPRLYTLSLALASFSWISTLYVHDLWGSTILFSCCGVAWAVSMWAPFSILGEVISQRMQEEQHQERLRVSRPQSHHSNSNGVGLDSIQVVYPKEGEGGGGYYGEGGESDSEGEEIGMVEGRSVAGSRYLPVRARESQDEVITVSSSSKNAVPITLDSFRSRTGTPSPTTLEGPSLPNETVGWTVQGKDFAHVDTDSETEDTSGGESSQDKSRHYHSNMNEDERRLVPKRSHHYRHQYPASTHHQHSKRKGSGNRPEGRTNPSNRRGNDPIRFSGAHPGQETPSSSSLPVSATSESSSAGALLGIHNIYIVLPQFLVSFLSSVVFAAIEPKNRQEEPSSAVGAGGDTLAAPGDPDTIGVMLRFGGIMAGIAAVLSLRLWKQPRVAQS